MRLKFYTFVKIKTIIRFQQTAFDFSCNIILLTSYLASMGAWLKLMFNLRLSLIHWKTSMKIS